MDERKYWVWAQHVFGCGSNMPFRILSEYPSLHDFWNAGKSAWKGISSLTEREQSMMRTFSPEDAERQIRDCEQKGRRVMTPDDPDFPECLKNIYAPPCALYIWGELPDLEKVPSIAIVGTRQATDSGKRIAFRMAYDLARAGAVVVSGGAVGIDTSAHRGALEAGGKTLYLLGCGMDVPYLPGNLPLREKASRSGAVITEFPEGTPPIGANFPIRNRLISGLSDGVLVVEAAKKSGALITADEALEQGRDVFAVPCSIDSPVSEGVNGLLKSGAKLVSDASEILEEYLYKYPRRMESNPADENHGAESFQPVKKLPDPPREGNASPDAVTLYRALGREAQHLAQLEKATGLPYSRLLTAVTELELSGQIKTFSGRRYSLPDEIEAH